MNDSLPLYGSQNNTYSQTLTCPDSLSGWTHGIGKRNYELSNHLVNVLSVVSDKVILHGTGGVTTPGTVVDYFLADIIQSTDYSPPIWCAVVRAEFCEKWSERKS